MAYKCHRLSLMFLFERPEELCERHKTERSLYMDRIRTVPILDENRRLSEQVVSMKDFYEAVRRIRADLLCYILVALHLLRVEYYLCHRQYDDSLNQLIRALGLICGAPAYGGHNTLQWPPGIAALRDHPPDILQYHRESRGVFASVEALLRSIGLPANEREVELILPITTAILKRRPNVSLPPVINKLLLGNQRQSPHASPAILELQKYLDVHLPTTIYDLEEEWLEPNVSQSGYSMARRWISKNLGKLMAQCMIPSSEEHVLSHLRREKIEARLNLELRFSGALLESHGESLADEGEVEPYLIENLIELIEVDLGMAYAIQMNGLKAAQSLRGRQLIDLYVSDKEGKNRSGMVIEKFPGNDVFFGGLLYALALQGFDVRNALQLMDIYELLIVRKPSLSCPLLLSLSICNMGTACKDILRLASLHLRWSENPASDDPRAKPPNWTNLLLSPDSPVLVNPLDLQQCSLLSLGLAFLHTGDVTLSKRLYQEIYRRGFAATIEYGRIQQTQNPAVVMRVTYGSAYSLCAGAALGLVNIGMGGSYECGFSNEAEVFQCISFDRTELALHQIRPAVIVAMTLIYMKTGIRLPQLDPLEKHPLIIQTLLTLAQHMIAWKSIDLNPKPFFNTFECLSDMYEPECLSARLVADLLYIGISGNGSLEQLRALKHDLEVKYSEYHNEPPFDLVFDYTLLALSIRLSGSGDPETWSSLRAWWRDPLSFSHPRCRIHHMALGFLCGSRRLKLESSQSIAFLYLSLLPIEDDFEFVNGAGSNTCRYLRYWWMMCLGEEQVKAQCQMASFELEVLLAGHQEPVERANLVREYLLSQSLLS